MDYEKKYKKALSRAEELMSRCVNNGDYKAIIYRAEDIESIFPELQEPDDDTIRKALLRGFKNYSIYYDTFGNADVNSIIAWLEKQGEKSDKWKEGDIVRHDGILALVIKGRNAMKSNFERIIIQYPDEWVKAGQKERECFFEKLEKQGEKSQGNTALETVKKEGIDNGKFE